MRCASAIHEVNATENMTTREKKMRAVEVAEVNFATEVLKSHEPVLVEFWTPWSRPCQILDSPQEAQPNAAPRIPERNQRYVL